MRLAVATLGADPKQLASRPELGYRLLERLGRGGSGEVWKAEASGGFLVALKFIPLANRLGTLEARALEILKTIHHPHVLVTFGSWLVADSLIIAMELADGTLWDRFCEASAQGLPGIPRSELIAAFADAAEGIDFLNKYHHVILGQPHLGIQHRDIKPQNLLLFGDGVKVADLGMARLLNQTAINHTGSWTFAYAAPEFFRNQTTRWSDQYSLAVSYCQLRSGRLPFRGSPAEVVFGHLMGEPDLTMLPEEERPILARALSKEPSQRWPHCRAFVEALQLGRPVEDLSAVIAVPAQATNPQGDPAPATSPTPGGPCRAAPADDPRWELAPENDWLGTSSVVGVDGAGSETDLTVPTPTSSDEVPVSASSSCPIEPIPTSKDDVLFDGDRLVFALPEDPEPAPDSPLAGAWPAARPLLRAAARWAVALTLAAGMVLWSAVDGLEGGPRPEASGSPPPGPTPRITLAGTEAPDSGRAQPPAAAEPGDLDVPEGASVGPGDAPDVLAVASTDRDTVAVDDTGGVGDAPEPQVTAQLQEPSPEADRPGTSDPPPLVPPLDVTPSVVDASPGPGPHAGGDLQAELAGSVGDAPPSEPDGSRDHPPPDGPPTTLPSSGTAADPDPMPSIGPRSTVLTLHVPDRLSLLAGERSALPIRVERAGIEGSVSLGFESVPDGVTLHQTTIPAGADEAAVMVTVAEDAPKVAGRFIVVGSAGPARAEARIPFIVGPLTPADYNYLGLARYREGRTAEALADFNEALRLDRRNIPALENRGALLAHAGRHAQAIADFSEALRLYPDNVVAYNNRGLAYRAQGDYPKAIADYDEAIRRDPTNATLHYNRALVLALMGDDAGAIAALSEAIRLKRDYAKAYKTRGDAYARLDKPALAAADHVRARQLGSEEPPVVPARTHRTRSLDSTLKTGTVEGRAGRGPS